MKVRALMDRMIYLSTVSILAGLILTSGCGGKKTEGATSATGASGSGGSGGGTGGGDPTPESVSLTLRWPERTRSVGLSRVAERISADLVRNGTAVSSLASNRPSSDSSGTSTVTFSNELYPGPYSLRIRQFSGASTANALSDTTLEVAVSETGALLSGGQPLPDIELDSPLQNAAIKDTSPPMRIGQTRRLEFEAEIQPGMRATIGANTLRWRLASSPEGCTLSDDGVLYAADYGEATIQAQILNDIGTQSVISIAKPALIDVEMHTVPTGQFTPLYANLHIRSDGSGFTQGGSPWEIVKNRTPQAGEMEQVYGYTDVASVSSRTSQVLGSYRNITLSTPAWGYVHTGPNSRKHVQGVCVFTLEDSSHRSDNQDVLIFRFTPNSDDPDGKYVDVRDTVLFFPPGTLDFTALS